VLIGTRKDLAAQIE
jgi:hypothetical protein